MSHARPALLPLLLLAALLCRAQCTPLRASTNASLVSPLLEVGLSVREGSAPRLDIFSFVGAGARTSNLGLVLPAGSLNGGGVQVAPTGHGGGAGGAVPVCVAPSCTLTTDGATVVTLAGLTTPAASSTESWTLRLLNASAWSLRVDRTWAAGAPAIAVDRLFFTFATTGGLPLHAEQIPSFVDLDMFLNETTSGGFDVGSGAATGTYDTGSAYEFLSLHARQYLRFSPTGASFTVEGSASLGGAPAPVLFSFARPFSDGTTWCQVGFEAVDPRTAPRAPPAPGTTQVLEMTWVLTGQDVAAASPAGAPPVPSAHAFPAMDFALPNATLAAQINTLMAVQYQLMGWIMGNNPASTPCLHEMAWWPLMASLFDAGSNAFPAMQRELTFFARCGWQAAEWSGDYEAGASTCNLTVGTAHGLSQRYNAAGFYGCPWGPLTDQDVMMPIAVYYTAASTGDVAWLASMRPALDAVAAFLAAHGLALPAAGGPVVYTSPASGLADGRKHASNWYDIVNFGHYDALLAAYGVWALQSLADVYAALGDAPAAARMTATHAQAILDYNALFWNASAAQYTDWIDIQGRKRHYFFSDIAFVAILAGIPSPNQTAALLAHYDARLAGIYAEYGVAPGTIWSPPSNLYPITNPLDMAFCQAGCDMAFPSYENGGAFFHSSGLQAAALGAAGRADAAVAAFATLANSGFGAVRGWAQQEYWAHNGAPPTLVGFDPLNTAALSVWGLFRAAFGVAPALGGRLRILNPPAAAFEGARWNVSVGGASTCLLVRDGSTIFCNGSKLGVS